MGQRLTESHGFIHENENMCRVSVRRDRSPLRLKTHQLWSDIVPSGERP